MSPRPFHRLAPLAIAVFAIAACTTQRETYVLLPDASGQAGSLQVISKQGQVLVLDGAYANARASAGRAPRPAALSQAEIERAFAEALSARPDAPLRFTLYFREGSDELTPDSMKALQGVLDAVRKRPAPDVIVVGHTDRVGLLLDNDRLALRRAERIRADLLGAGLSEESVQAAGRGEREPLVATADEQPEPRNRRVEILVR